jgi:formate dehydrogenase subunit gamma
MTTTPFEARLREHAGWYGRTVVHDNELVRHTPYTRVLHWGIAICFILALLSGFAFQFLNWYEPMRWKPEDRRWMRGIRSYVTNADPAEPEDTGFFNAGQKLYFWLIAASALLFLITGIPMWFPEIFGRLLVAVSYVLHDIAALVMLGGFIVHVYEGTAVAPGTFRSMTRGTVENRWARKHHPAWYRAATGRGPERS